MLSLLFSGIRYFLSDWQNIHYSASYTNIRRQDLRSAFHLWTISPRSNYGISIRVICSRLSYYKFQPYFCKKVCSLCFFILTCLRNPWLGHFQNGTRIMNDKWLRGWQNKESWKQTIYVSENWSVASFLISSFHISNYLYIFFPNIFQDCLQPFGNKMLSRVRLRGINAHSVTPPAR